MHDKHREEAIGRKPGAGLGSTVEVVDRYGRTTIYQLVARAPDPVPQRVTIESAEGAALLGARPGDALTIRTANGRRRRVRVLDVDATTSDAAASGCDPVSQADAA